MLQLRTLVKSTGTLELSLAEVETPAPGPGEILVRIEATPINPSDIGLLFGAADMSTAVASGTPDRPVVTASIAPAYMRAMAARVDDSMPAGNEGGGTVTAAGEGAEHLVGKKVGIIGGAMYAEYRVVRAKEAIVLPDGATAEDGASCFVNPLTALGMTETMRREGHTALVHTAAASNLGQMLNRICIKDGIALVNIVRSAEQAETLRALGATHIVDSTNAGFMEDVVAALVDTGATIAFDAIGGGKLAGQILTAMEIAINKTAKEYSRYGSAVHKQVYIYGGLNMAPTEFNRGFGMAWSMGGWLLFPFLQKIGAADAQKLRDRVAAELTTTFASHYSHRVSLAEALSLEAIAGYNKRATGEKYLIVPNAG
ncbi:MAG: NADH oxidase [Alphaproteobacteria bacterium]|nr:MAG: NADH oxidase [Alphaproteobacteria bacterium]